MIRLYIENNEIDLDKNVQFAITKQFEELSNPTIIINDWSKTVSIPFTTHNHSVFGHIYSPDKVSVAGSGMGIYFDPLKKLDFRLEWDNTVLMTGYAKMNEIKQKDGSGTYEITLFGQLGKVFQEMQKITFDVTTEDTDYLIDGSTYIEEYINRNLVYSSWTSSGQQESSLQEKYRYYYNPTTGLFEKESNPMYSVTDIIGFAPNNSFSEEFNYGTLLVSSTATRTIEELLALRNFEASTGIAPGSVIPNGLLPREYGDYRSYLQLPFIYWNKLWKIFQEKAEDITGYTFELDSDWFNENNPYWYKLVYMLKNFNTKKGNTIYNTYDSFSSGELQWSKNQGELPYSTVLTLPLTISAISEKTERLDNNSIKIEMYDNTNISIYNISFYITGEMNHNYDIIYTLDNCFIINLNFTGSNGHVETKLIVVYRDGTENEDVLTKVRQITNAGGFAYAIPYDDRWGIQYDITSSSQYGWYITLSGENLLNLKQYTFGDSVTISISAGWMNNHTVMGAAEGSSISEFCWMSNFRMDFQADVQEKVFRSGSYIILNDLWNNEYNIFNEIIKYCKMFRINVSLDELNKKIKFTQFNKYFENYGIVDWTNKVDKSKDFNIVPVTFDAKYVMFNYEDYDSKISKQYKEKYGLNFGEYKLATDYNFNTEKDELFKGVKIPLICTDNVLSYNTLLRNEIKYSFPAEICIDNKDKDKKEVDTFGQFYFHCGLGTWSRETGLYMTIPKISDDTTFMSDNNTFFYIVNLNYTACSTYPLLNVVYGDNLCLFNIPKENFTYQNNYSDKHSVYYNFWQKYLDERYNVQNKKVTCYIKLTPSDWNNFSFNNFVKINNQLYIVNKIYDYDITENSTTKVDLITIQDVSAYTTNNFS